MSEKFHVDSTNEVAVKETMQVPIDDGSKSVPLVQSVTSQPASTDDGSKSVPLVQSVTSQPASTDDGSKSVPLVQSVTSQPASTDDGSKSVPLVRSVTSQPASTDDGSKSVPIIQSLTSQPASTDDGSKSVPIIQSVTSQPAASSLTQCESVSEEPTVGTNHKTRKKRTKGLQKKIQEQIEFYFSDSNLAKDRFMKQRMAEHKEGYVSLEIISNFNRMKALSTNVDIILQAIKKSSLLQLSPDKKMIKRITPLQSVQQEEVDSRTIYVENIPKTDKTDHDSLKRMFSQFGQVTYISLPKYKKTSSLKGFAFVEFSTVDSACEAVEHFKQKSTNSPEDNEPSIQPSLGNTVEAVSEDTVFVNTVTNNEEFVCDNKIEEGKTAKRFREEEEGGDKISYDSKRMRIESKDDQDVVSTDRPTKRLREEEVLCDNVQGSNPNPKRVRTESNAGTELSFEEESTKDDNESAAVTDRKRSRDSDSVDLNDSNLKNPRLDSTWSEFSAIEEDGDDELKKKKKTRVHKRKRRDSKLKEMDLRVISKVEWLEIKQLYKKMQKDRMKIVKENNKKVIVKPQTDMTQFVSDCLIKVSCHKTDDKEPVTGDSQPVTEDSQPVTGDSQPVTGDNEPVTVDSLETFCSKYGPVAYVDFETGADSGFVRFGTSGCAKKVVESEQKMSNVSFETVSEEEEKAYFIKTRAARRKYFTINKRRHQTRGLDKVISRAIKRTDAPMKKTSSQAIHIRFSDSDDS